MKHLFNPFLVLFLLFTGAGKAQHKILNCFYDNSSIFDHGLARVQRNGKFGFINKKGKEVIPCKYHWINFFSSVSGLASLTDSLNNFGFMDREGNIVVSPNYQAVYDWDKNTGLIYVQRHGKFGFINNKGVEVIPCIYEQTQSTPEFFFNGRVRVKKNGKYGILDVNGNILLPFEYDYFIGFEWLDGFPAGFMGAKKGGAYFYINMKTLEVLKTNYTYAGEFNEDMAPVELKGKWGYINSSFLLAIPCRYKNTRPFSEGLAAVMDSTGKWGFVTKTGNLAIPFVYDEVRDFSCGRALVAKDSKVGIVNKQGRLILPFEYDHSNLTGFYTRKKDFNAEFCALKKSNNYGWVDTMGRPVTGFIYDNVFFAERYRLNLWDWFPIAENYALAQKDNQFFVINSKGEQLNAPGSNRLIYFIEHRAYVCDSNNTCGFINSKGKLVIPFKYGYYEESCFKKGFAVIKLSDRFGIINGKGKKIIPTSYEELSNFNNGLARGKKDNVIYFLNKKGKVKLMVRKPA